ncbi:MAG: hypothetical protein ACOC33_00960 [bacterium]
MKYQVKRYIETFGTKNFKDFLLSPFILDDIVKYFHGWKRKEMVNWVTYKHNDYQIDVYSGEYEILNNITRKKYKIPIPKTINDFINDMYRLDINLEWGMWIEKKFKPKDFLEEKQIVEYYKDLLKKLNKEHELIYKEEDEQN